MLRLNAASATKECQINNKADAYLVLTTSIWTIQPRKEAYVSTAQIIRIQLQVQLERILANKGYLALKMIYILNFQNVIRRHKQEPKTSFGRYPEYVI